MTIILNQTTGVAQSVNMTMVGFVKEHPHYVLLHVETESKQAMKNAIVLMPNAYK